MSLRLDVGSLEAAVLPQLLEVAERIAATAARRYRFSRLRRPGVIDVVVNDGHPVVVNRSSFGHLDEYGTVRLRPVAAMRSAAAEAGRFVELPK